MSSTCDRAAYINSKMEIAMELTAELKKDIRDCPNTPIQLTDPETNEDYVLIRREVFERIDRIIPPDRAEAEGCYQLAMDAFREGWNDPAMDVYDALDPRKT